MVDVAERTRLTRVRIEGFRSIAYADLELRDVNVFIGANGAGKSNFVGFLQMLGAIMRGRLERFVNEQRGANALLHLGGQHTPKLSGQVEVALQESEVRYVFQVSLIGADRLVFDSENVLFRPSDASTPPDLPYFAGGLESMIPKVASLPAEGKWGSATRNVQATLASVFQYHLNNSTSTSLMRGYQALRENLRLLGQGENTAIMLMRMRNEFPDRYERIRDEMRHILPGFEDFVLEAEPSRGMEQVELRWTSQSSDYIMGPDQLSDGSIRAVSLLTLLLQPDEWKPGIIVIDEPELGLHPYAVGQIGRLIAEAGTTRQIVVSTQSPGLVAQFEPEDVVVVESENGASTFRRLDRESLAPWLEAYDGDLGRLFEMNVTGGAPQ